MTAEGQAEPLGEPPEGSSPAPAPPRPEPWEPSRLVRLAVLFYAALGGVALLWRGGLGGENLFYANPLGLARGVRLAVDLPAGVAAALAVIVVSHELTRRTQLGAELARTLARALGPLAPSQCVVLALASGIGEEAFFRGALQPRVGLLAASLIFGLAHLAPRRELRLWSVFSLLAGLLLGALYELTGNLLAPLTAHVLVNAVNLQLLVRGAEREASQERGSRN